MKLKSGVTEMTDFESSMQFFRNYGLVQFDDLDDSAKVVAIEKVVNDLKAAHTKEVSEAKAKYQDNKNKAINDPIHIKRNINGMEALNKFRATGNDYLLKFIRSNLIWFLPSGEMVDIYTHCTEENKITK